MPIVEPERARYGRAGGAGSPSSGSTSRPASSRIRCGEAPLECRNQTAPSGRTCAHSIWPSGCSIGVSVPVASVEAMEPVPAVVELCEQEQRARVRPPVRDRDLTLEPRGDLRPLPRHRIPEGGLRDAVPLVDDGEATVADDR